MRWGRANAKRAHLHRLGLSYIFVIEAMRTLLVALLFGFPILGGAADDRPASNWIWELPGERQSFTGLLTDPQFRMVIRELESRRGLDFMRVDFKPLPLPGPYGDAFSYPVGPVVVPPPRNSLSKSIEAAEILNGLRMDGYRRHCETLRHSELQGTPALYPAQIPWLRSP